MIQSYVKTYDRILAQIDEVSLAHFYLSMQVGRKYKSFFRSDPKPSAGLYFTASGRLRYNDFINNMSLPEVIMALYNLTYTEFLRRVSRDFNLDDIQYESEYKQRSIIINSQSYQPVKKSGIKVRRREFNLKDIAYWNSYGISDEWLIRANICPIDYFWIIKDENQYLYKADTLAYSYNYYWYNNVLLRKVYQPKSKEAKWFSNINSTVVQGWHMLPKQGSDLLIITSSYKDAGTIHCNLNLNVIAPNNEMSFLPEKIIPKLNQRFKTILVWFDNDKGGFTGAKRFKQRYGWDYIHIPLDFPKDPSDFYHTYNKSEFIQMSNTIIKNKLYELGKISV